MASSIKRPDREPDFIIKLFGTVESFWVKELIEEYCNGGTVNGTLYKIQLHPELLWFSEVYSRWESFGAKHEIIQTAYKKYLISKVLKEKLSE